jgi:hypothetical protein
MEITPKKIISVAGAILGVVGGWIALDSHYVTQAFHDLCEIRTYEKIEDTEKMVAGLQKEIAIQRAQDQLYFWIRVEMELYKAHKDHPQDAALQQKYLNAVQERQKAEQELKRLQGK